MRFIDRQLAPVLLAAYRHFPAVVVTGPRRAGKTTLLRKLFPKARYVLLEDPDIQAQVRSDPSALIGELQPPVVFDEIQNAPELLAYVRTLIDTKPRRMGQWLFTGSQEAPLKRGITESMAGRVAILQLLPFSLAEVEAEARRAKEREHSAPAHHRGMVPDCHRMTCIRKGLLSVPRQWQEYSLRYRFRLKPRYEMSCPSAVRSRDSRRARPASDQSARTSRL